MNSPYIDFDNLPGRFEDRDPVLAIAENWAWCEPARLKDIKPVFPMHRPVTGWRKVVMQTALYITTGSWPKEVNV